MGLAHYSNGETGLRFDRSNCREVLFVEFSPCEAILFNNHGIEIYKDTFESKPNATLTLPVSTGGSYYIFKYVNNTYTRGIVYRGCGVLSAEHMHKCYDMTDINSKDIDEAIMNPEHQYHKIVELNKTKPNYIVVDGFDRVDAYIKALLKARGIA